MELTGWSYCCFLRLNIAHVWKSAPRYNEGYESEITQRTAICECGAAIVFLLLIEEK